jgi:hypothetical protein
LAQPPDITDTFVREVDENLRRDRASDFARKYGAWLIAAVVLFIAASGGFIYWQNVKLQRSERQVEQLAEVFKNLGGGDNPSATRQLDELSQSGSKGVRATALFTRAAVAIQQNDVKLATAKYREIVGDKGLPKPYRDAALIRQTALEFDQLQPQEIVARLQPLAQRGNPWFGTAGEMTAMALIKQGKKTEAGQLFAAIAKDTSVPPSLRARSVQIAGSLGVDASSAIAVAPAQ